jgi:hypothetical protein
MGVHTPHYVFMREQVLCECPLSKHNKLNRHDKTHRARKSSPVFLVHERHNMSGAVLGGLRGGRKTWTDALGNALWEYRGGHVISA